MVSSDDTEITTNDDDPDSGYDEKILKVLKQRRTRAFTRLLTMTYQQFITVLLVLAVQKLLLTCMQ